MDRPFAFVALEVLGRGGEKAGRLRFVVATADVDAMTIVMWKVQNVHAGGVSLTRQDTMPKFRFPN